MATTVKATITTGEKNVALIIHDAESVGAALLDVTGHEELGKALTIISRYVDEAIKGATDAHAIEITADNIAALLPDVQLDPPEEAGTGGPRIPSDVTDPQGLQSGTQGAADAGTQQGAADTGAQGAGTGTGTQTT